MITTAICLLTIMSGYGGCINPDVWALPSMMTLAFPAMALMSLLTSVVWAFTPRRIMTVPGIFTIILCAGPIMSYFPLSSQNKPSAGAKSFTLMTYNVYYGIDREIDDLPYSRTMSYILHSGADIVCLQEQYNLSRKDNPAFTPEQADSIRAVYPYAIETTRHNMMALSKYPMKRIATPFQYEINYYFYDAYEAVVHGDTITILNLHLNSYNLSSSEREVAYGITSIAGMKNSLNEMKNTIYDKLAAAFAIRAASATEVRRFMNSLHGNIIVCGDFNDIPDSWSYRKIAGRDMKDAYAETCFGPMTTFNAHHLFFHIDQILYRGKLKPLKVERGSIKSSDHYPLTATFELTSDK